ncbi:Calx-beta domain-containing protein [Hugenholtzia roseola]|uniref:Calx-beta domain-containing protein n=1 Tax=Hugenholtzia roseola TaxID=1002 RepID=UPI0004171366|nr:hypothetical protein [Hugenholtzia roseola]
MKKNLLIFLACFFALAWQQVWGQAIFENPITGTNPNTSNPYTTGQTVNANLTVSGIGRGSGISGTGATNRYNANGWESGSLATAIANNDYFEFTLTPNAGFQINFTSFVYTAQRSNTNIANFSFRSSLDGFASNIGSPTFSGTTIDLSAAQFQGITSAVTFRLYAWGTNNGTGTFSINDFTFNGTVTSAAPLDTEVRFSATSSSALENAGSFNIPVQISNPSASTATSVQVVLLSGDAARLNNYTTQTLTFPAGSSAVQNLTLSLTNDNACLGNENYLFELQNVSGGTNASAVNPTQHQFTLIEDENTATTLFWQGFEGGGTWNITAGAGNLSNNTGAADAFLPNARIRTGKGSWQVSNANASLVLENLNTTAYSDMQVEIFLSSTATNAANGADGTDEVRAFVALDGAAFSATPDIRLTGFNNGKWDYSQATATTSAGTPLVQNTNTTKYSKLVIQIPNGTTSLSLRIEAQNDNNDEIWNIDDISLRGSLCALPDVLNPTATAFCTDNLDLSWTLPADYDATTDEVLVFLKADAPILLGTNTQDYSGYTPNPNFTDASPLAATPYPFDNAAKLVYRGDGTNVNVFNLMENRFYYAQIFHVRNSNQYSYGLHQIAKTAANPAPINSLSAQAQNASASLTWLNPDACYDEIMAVVGVSGFSATPVGDGAGYTASATYGSGTAIGGGFVAFKSPTGNRLDLSGLSNGTTYCAKFFVRKGSTWSQEREVCFTPNTGKILYPGDMAIIGWDAQTSGADDEIHLVTLVELTPQTQFIWCNATFENGNAAFSRNIDWETNTSFGWDDIQVRQFTWNGASSIPAGTVISFESVGIGSGIANIRLNGVATAAFTVVGSGSGGANISTSNADQMFVMQGTFDIPNGSFQGNVLFGMSNDATWVNLNQNAGTSRTSRLHPHILCLNVAYGSNREVAFYNTTALHTGSQSELLANIVNTGNWTATGTTVAPTLQSTNFNVSAAASLGTWVGNGGTASRENWFECQNWEHRFVPDRRIDVSINNLTNDNADIDAASTAAREYDRIARCKNLTLSQNQVILDANGGNDLLRIYGNFNLSGAGLLNMSDGNNATEDGKIQLFGNWTNAVGKTAFAKGNGSVELIGANHQNFTTVAANAEEDFYRLILNKNPQAHLFLASQMRLQIDHELVLTQGVIFTDSLFWVVFDENAVAIGGSKQSFIHGEALKLTNSTDIFLMPLGKLIGTRGRYNPLEIEPQGAAAASFAGEYFPSAYSFLTPVENPPLDRVSHLEHWSLDRRSGTTPAKVTLHYTVEADGGYDMSGMVVARWEKTGAALAQGIWRDQGQDVGRTYGSVSEGYVTSAVFVNTFEPFATHSTFFTLGTFTDLNPLPVTWLSFEATLEAQGVWLEWKTAQELNADYFEIEKSLENEATSGERQEKEPTTTFQKIGSLKAKGSTNAIQKYRFLDPETHLGKVYYRLKQVDFDGTVHYSPIISVSQKQNDLIQLYSADKKVFLKSNLKEAQTLSLLFYDTKGSLLASYQVQVPAGSQLVSLPTLPKGLLLFQILPQKNLASPANLSGKVWID